MRLEAAIRGNLVDFMKQQKDQAEAAVTSGIREVTTRIKDDLRTLPSISFDNRGII